MSDKKKPLYVRVIELFFFLKSFILVGLTLFEILMIVLAWMHAHWAVAGLLTLYALRDFGRALRNAIIMDHYQRAIAAESLAMMPDNMKES